MTKKLDRIGQRFGRLLIVADAPRVDRFTRYICLCDCGITKVIQSGNLVGGRSLSCGCLRVEQLSARNSDRQTTHGMSQTPLYKQWSGMLNRCRNPNSKDYSRYGGRGIGVDVKWLDFPTFKKDMGPRPSSRHSVERLDNALGYSPGNCVWALPSQQQSNRRDTVFMEHLGMTKTVSAWADFAGLKRETVFWRYWRGDRGAHLLRPPKRGRATDSKD